MSKSYGNKTAKPETQSDEPLSGTSPALEPIPAPSNQNPITALAMSKDPSGKGWVCWKFEIVGERVIKSEELSAASSMGTAFEAFRVGAVRTYFK